MTLSPFQQLAALLGALVLFALAFAALSVCAEGLFTGRTRTRQIARDRERLDTILHNVGPVDDTAEQMVRANLARCPPVPLRVVPNTDERDIRIEAR